MTAPARIPPNPFTKLIVLVIDDSMDDRENCIRHLRKIPDVAYSCLEAAEGAAGIEIISSLKPDCVLLDYSLPGFNGLQILKQIRDKHSFIPVILLTGQGNEAVAVQAIKEGANNYFTKSAASFGTLHEAITEAIAHSAWKRELAEKDHEIREKAEALAASERRYHLLVDGVADYAIYMLDTKGYVQSWNTGAERIKQYKEEEILGQHFSIFYTEDECQAGKPVEVLTKAAAVGKHTSESWLVRKNGSRFCANIMVDALRDPQGNLIGFSNVIRDVTERRKMETALRYSEKRNELALQGLGVGLWDWNIVTDDLYWSPRFKEILGIGDPNMTFHLADFSGRLHPDDRDMVLAKLEGHIRKQGPYDAECRLKRVDGTYVWIRARGLCEWDHVGQPLRMVGSVEDISARKAVDRLKDEFVAMVSHELRTPLTSIHGALGLICGGMTGELAPKTAGLTQIAYKNSERLSLIINDILDVEKIESGTMQMELRPIEVMPFLSQALESNRAYGDKYKVTFAFHGEPVAARVLADSARLMQAFTNLLSNAAKFSPPGSTVHVFTERHNDCIRFNVRDYGEGIPYEFRSRIFEKFSQADSPDTRRCDGTGLGLNIAKKIISLMNGNLGFDSKIGAGTTFYFDLPDADRAEEVRRQQTRGAA